MRTWTRLCAAFSLAAVCLSAAPNVALRTPDSLDAAFHRLYSQDFAGGQQLLGNYTAAHPEDPLGHAARGAAYLFEEMTRRQVLGKGTFSEKAVSEPKRRETDPRVRAAFFAAVERAEVLATQRLAAQPQDRNALLALCLAHGLQRDYAALVDKRLRDSLEHAKLAQSHAVRLLKVDPAAHDAYFTIGFSEYLLGSMPFFLRWAVKLEDVQGSKQRGLRILETAARSGRYLRPFAQMLLATLYVQEKRPADSRRLLAQLATEFPENPVFGRELARMR